MPHPRAPRFHVTWTTSGVVEVTRNGLAVDDRRMEPARRLWQVLETINAVTYFSPECRQAPERLGMKGFWMGYFACRAAPMGPVAPGVVEATFFNFHPGRVRRAIPDAWTYAAPAAVVSARAEAAATALRRLLPDGAAERLAADALPVLGAVTAEATAAGRPLFAANRDVDSPADPVAALWQSATTLREHRGDSHVALLAGAGLDGCDVHVLVAAVDGAPPELYQASRGWSPEDWQAAVERLAGRGLVTASGGATPAGHERRDDIERRTDELALMPYTPLGDNGVEALIRLLRPAAERIARSGEISFPNPMGLPPLTPP
jgi:hypothetical protein